MPANCIDLTELNEERERERKREAAGSKSMGLPTEWRSFHTTTKYSEKRKSANCVDNDNNLIQLPARMA